MIRRVIKADGRGGSFSINGMDANRTKVMKLAKKYHIQIDNLCQFLPQDKVSEFAALTPVELLKSTQRAAAGPQMLELHDSLIKLRAEQKKLLSESRGDRELLANLQNRQELQRGDVERIRERAQIKRQIEALELCRPIATYYDYLTRYKEIKARKREVDEQYKKLKTEVAPALAAVNAKQDYFTQTDNLVQYKRQRFAQAEGATKEVTRRMDAHENSLKNLTSQIDAEKKSGMGFKNQLNTIQQTINRITRQMEEKPEDFDIDSYNEKIVSNIGTPFLEPLFLFVMTYSH